MADPAYVPTLVWSNDSLVWTDRTLMWDAFVPPPDTLGDLLTVKQDRARTLTAKQDRALALTVKRGHRVP